MRKGGRGVTRGKLLNELTKFFIWRGSFWSQTSRISDPDMHARVYARYMRIKELYFELTRITFNPLLQALFWLPHLRSCHTSKASPSPALNSACVRLQQKISLARPIVLVRT